MGSKSSTAKSCSSNPQLETIGCDRQSDVQITQQGYKYSQLSSSIRMKIQSQGQITKIVQLQRKITSQENNKQIINKQVYGQLEIANVTWLTIQFNQKSLSITMSFDQKSLNLNQNEQQILSKDVKCPCKVLVNFLKSYENHRYSSNNKNQQFFRDLLKKIGLS